MKPAQSLSQLLQSLQGEVQVNSAVFDTEITHITSDSREVTTGSLFVAIKGESQDGHQFIEEVLQKGAAAVLVENAGSPSKKIISVSDTRKSLGLLAACFYDYPSRKMKMIGVTGTSGKTTTTYLLESIFLSAGYSVGLLGTVEFRFKGTVIPSTHTTPGAVELQKLLSQMLKNGCDTIIMEVSSHALKQHRAIGIAWDGVLFTNLTPEHLDYHPDMKDYYDSKKILFDQQITRSIQWGKQPKAAAIAESTWGESLCKDTPHTIAVRKPKDLQLSADGISGTFSGIFLKSPLIGGFNVENIAGAVALAKLLSIAPEQIKKGIESLWGVPGRMDRLEGAKKIFVDYAHKPDALLKVLKTFRGLLSGNQKLWCVFGCGGNRDRQKRPEMGKIAAELADYVIITSDNPRNEDPHQIAQEILKGIPAEFSSRVSLELDRKKAIDMAIKNSDPDDWVLIAGKGHETYQIIGSERRHFDDKDIARQAVVKLQINDKT